LEQVRRLGVDARHQPLAALDDCHLGAQPAVELGELAPCDAAAQHEQAYRHVVCRRRLPCRPRLDAVEAIERRRDRGGAGRDHEPVVLELVPVQRDHARPVDAAAPADERDTMVVEPPHLAGVVPVGHLPVAPGEDLFRVEWACSDTGRALSSGPELGRP
jgi:hypothetical protein